MDKHDKHDKHHKKDKHHKHDKHDKHDKHHKRDKERMKELETDEEKRARRLAKKAAKDEKRAEEGSLGGYSNQSNPWNDPNLTQAFVWGKKVDKDQTRGVVEDQSREAQKRKRLEQQVELEKVKRAREQREIDREAYEEERRMLDRDREQLAFDEHQKREDEFQLEQSKMRVKRRVQEGRAKPIDVLADSLRLLDDGFDPSDALETKVQDPLLVLNDSLNERELAELRGVFNLFAARSREEKNALISALDQLVAEKAARESVVVAP